MWDSGVPAFLLRGASAAPGPDSVSGLDFWLRQSDVASFGASAITSWTDHANGLVLDSLGSGDLFYRSSSAFGPSVCFEDGAALLNTTGYARDRRGWSAYFVIRANDVGQTHRIIDLNDLNLVIFIQNGVLKTYQGFTNVTTFAVPVNQPICVVVTSGASNIKVYVDAAANVQNKTAASSSTGLGLYVSSGATYCGELFEVGAWPRELNSTEVGVLMAYAKSKFLTGSSDGVTTVNGRVIIDGDSVSHGAGSTRNAGWPQKLGYATGWLAHNFGIVGQTVDSMITNQSVNTSPLANSTNWLFVEGGYNDLSAGATGATVEGRFNTYCTQAIADGFSKSKIVVFTLSGALSQFAERDNANALLRANYTGYAGHLVDIAADTHVGCVTGAGLWAAGSAGYVYDGVHPNDLGYQRWADLIRAAVTLPF